jgi:hypothetical protein
MQIFMAIEIPALTMDLMPLGHLSITATITVETNPAPFPSHPNWCYFTGTIEQHHYVQPGGDSRSHNNSQVLYSIIIT